MVEIIPKEQKETPGWQRALTWVSFVLLVAVGAASAAFPYLSSQSTERLREVNQRLQEVTPAEQRSLEQEILVSREKIEDVSALFSSRKNPLGALAFLERTTLPQVFYSDASVQLKNNTIGATGLASDFRTLEQQLKLLREHPDVRAVTMSDMGIGDEGVSFTLTITLSADALQ